MIYKRLLKYFSLPVIFLLVLLFAAWPPSGFAPGTTVKVKSGLTISQIGEELKSKELIKAPFLFKTFATLLGGKEGVIAGDYLFTKPITIFSLSKRLVSGNFGFDLKKVTIPEGATAQEIGWLIRKAVPEFDLENYEKLALPLEGYLFPDTYFFSIKITPEEAIEQLRNNFEEKTKPLLAQLRRSGKELNEILVMASLLEEEAKTEESRKIISGILWKRIDDGMLLQVDAVFPYIMNKNTYELSLKDLKIDSPYNTYKYKGLPPAPISNPGLGAMVAALEPKESPYWFYLSDQRGQMHYAADFDEHKANKAKYLWN